MQENNLPECSIHLPPGLQFPVQIMVITAHIISHTRRNLACGQLKYFQLVQVHNQNGENVRCVVHVSSVPNVYYPEKDAPACRKEWAG